MAQATQKTISPESYSFLQRWIHRESGIVIDQNKDYLLASRLNPVLEREHMNTMDELCAQLRNGKPGISRQVVEAMTTHETLFFRDCAPFDALRDFMMPALMAKRPKGHRYTFWSAAASSGQEAYSIAITLLEMGLTGHEVSILATDLSEKVLQRAREGLYGEFETNRGLTSTLRDRYFERDGKDWRVRERVRQMVTFRQCDLRGGIHGKGPFDVVLCRNVLIYFDPPTKESVLQEMSGVISRGGYLLLGASESAGSMTRSLHRIQMGEAVAYTANEV